MKTTRKINRCADGSSALTAYPVPYPVAFAREHSVNPIFIFTGYKDDFVFDSGDPRTLSNASLKIAAQQLQPVAPALCAVMT